MNRYFFDLPEELLNPATARFLLLPIPYDATASFLKGTVYGPEAILAVADKIEHLDEELRCEFWREGIAVLPEIPPQATPEEEMRLIEKTVRAYEAQYQIFSSRTRFPIILGGEHSITPPVVRVAAEVVESLSVLQFDAHSDLRDEYTLKTVENSSLGNLAAQRGGGMVEGEACYPTRFGYTDTRYSHGCAMRRVLESTPHLVQVGIRSFSAEELHDCRERIDAIITPTMLEQAFDEMVELIISRLTQNVYISIDIDGFDPAFAPGTGTPEPGGLTWRQVTRILRRVCAARCVVGADIVEVAPRGGNDVVTEFLAARLAAKLMAYTQVG